MRKRTLGAVLLAGLAVSGTGAFTASNTFSNTTNVAGYGSSTATGATVTNVSYTTLSTDATKLASVVFTTTTNITNMTAKMTLMNGTAVLGASPYACTLGTWNAVTTSMTVTCATGDNPAVANLTSTGLTVTQ
ncbi:MAG: hypothetical protein NVSMB55_08610 [Mycobacteriales bacterium]